MWRLADRLHFLGPIHLSSLIPFAPISAHSSMRNSASRSCTLLPVASLCFTSFNAVHIAALCFTLLHCTLLSCSELHLCPLPGTAVYCTIAKMLCNVLQVPVLDYWGGC